MKENEIIESNKIIAEFLGYKQRENGGLLWGTESLGGLYPKDLKYHYSYDWLMPVIEKIESIEDPYQGRFGVYICSNNCTIQSTNFRPDEKSSNPPYYFNSVYGFSKIEAVWIAVVKFIKWYNSCQKE